MHNKINNQYVNNVQYCCRVPQGTCGLKSLQFAKLSTMLQSGPARDLWIEIEASVKCRNPVLVGSRKGPVD